jgi:arylsulfatase B
MNEARYTPRLDILAKDSTVLSRSYTFRICSPSRCSFQSGRYGVNVNTVNINVMDWNKTNPVTGFPGVPPKMTGIASVLKSKGYQTLAVGKWDIGMTQVGQTPWARGYDAWLGYYHHAIDYYFATPPPLDQDVCNANHDMIDLWKYNATFNGPAIDERLKMTRSGNTINVEEFFLNFTLSFLDHHDTKKPWFIYYAFHLVHDPLEPPCDWLNKYDCQMFEERRKYAAMVSYLDWEIGVLVDKLHKNNLWDNTLLVISSDNGGPIYHGGGANNFPMMGGKEADWEGGIRVASLVSGGFLPKAKRGTVTNSIISIADWYSTFATLAGAITEAKHDAPAVAVGLPDIDGVDQWPAITKGIKVRNEIHISDQTLIQGKWKFMMGKFTNAARPGRIYPDTQITGRPIHVTPVSVEQFEANFPGSAPYIVQLNQFLNQDSIVDCGDDGCLYNVEIDPYEKINVASSFTKIRKMMKARLIQLNQKNYNPNRGIQCNTNSDSCCNRLWKTYRHGYGPFVGLDNELLPVVPVPVNSGRRR